MATGSGIVTELRLEADGISGRITCSPGIRPAPGQYLIASSHNPIDPMPIPLFPSRIANGELHLASPLPASWTVGQEISLRGPLGRGFRMPVTARRIALASLEGSPTRLLPLAFQALTQRAAVAIYTNAIPSGLPEEVEVLPLDLLYEAQDWADFLALEVSVHNLPNVRARLGINAFQRPACPVQVLVITAMPCSGLAECGICAVATQKGWALACIDGPVFDFNQLEGL
jgi:NAD(P)H-flavin reductase